MKCKGGEPALLPVRNIEGRIVSKGEGEVRGMEGRETKLQKEINQRKEEYDKEKVEKAREKEREEEEMRKMERELQEENYQQDEFDPSIKGPARPKFHTIYTYSVDYGDYI